MIGLFKGVIYRNLTILVYYSMSILWQKCCRGDRGVVFLIGGEGKGTGNGGEVGKGEGIGGVNEVGKGEGNGGLGSTKGSVVRDTGDLPKSKASRVMVNRSKEKITPRSLVPFNVKARS